MNNEWLHVFGAFCVGVVLLCIVITAIEWLYAKYTTASTGKYNTFVRYIHHDTLVWVRYKLLGKHRDHCLCYSCKSFKKDPERYIARERSDLATDCCPIAESVYKNCIEHNIVTPVWECKYFEECK